MHLHVARVRRNGKVYEYAQLVESYRRDDGQPTQRVIAKLGSLSPLEVENLRAAIRANRQGKSVVVTGGPARGGLPSRPVQNLRYLDLAVLRELWRELGLDALLGELMPRGEADVAPADVVAALAMQRCVDPGSKLYAERWFPRTALPELFGIAPSAFNNTRLHRVLDELDEISERLMVRLPGLYEQHQGAFTALFLDMTDTWFVGDGPALAERAKTKEGVVSQKVGIALLCNERGYPLRWEVVNGKQAEAGTMHRVVREVAGLPWARETPLVMDRAMGASAEIAKLLGCGVRFVTALRTNEFGAYTDRVPHQALAELPEEVGEEAVARAAERVVAAGMRRVSDTMYVLDLGVIERDAAIARASSPPGDGGDLARSALVMAQELERMVHSGEAESLASAARRIGMSRHLVKWYRPLLLLAPDLQALLIDGRAVGLSISQLVKIARMKDQEEQRRAFEHLVATAPCRNGGRPGPAELPEPAEPPRPLRVRAVVNFNPERFVTERRHAREALDQVQAHVKALNTKLAAAKSQRSVRSIERELEEVLRRRSFLDLYAIAIGEQTDRDGTKCFQARLTLDADRWSRRRRHDGFSIIVAHPDLAMSAAAISKLYRDKDAVEKDFQIIKSLVRLRPVWHHTDVKVRAHVTVCMLALLLERVLSSRLRSKISSQQALELLAGCHLNRFHDALYVLTEPDPEQRALLRKLHLETLADDAEVAARLRPRASDPVASTRKA